MKNEMVRITPQAHEALNRIRGESSKRAFLSALILFIENNDFNLKLNPTMKRKEEK